MDTTKSGADFLQDPKLLIQQKIIQNLIKYVFRDMPKNYTKLKKALFVYFKLCSVLRYDDSFYNTSNKDSHKDITKYQNITPKNPDVICTDFSAIYAVLLKHLKLKPQIYVMGSVSGRPTFWKGENFPTNASHIWVEFDVENMTICADATPSILSGDLACFKYGARKVFKKSDRMMGLFAKTENSTELLDFEKDVYDVMQKIMFGKSQQQLKYDEQRILKYVKAQQLNSSIKKDVLSVPFEIRLRLMLKIVEKVDLHNLELAQYLVLLSDKLFAQNEDAFKDKNGMFKFTFVRSNTKSGEQTEVVLSFKTTQHNEKTKLNYCILDGKKPPMFLTKQQLKQKFLDNSFTKLKEEGLPMGIRI